MATSKIAGVASHVRWSDLTFAHASGPDRSQCGSVCSAASNGRRSVGLPQWSSE